MGTTRRGTRIGSTGTDIQLFLENYADTPYEVLEEFVEVHTGSDNDRPQLTSAIALAKKENAVLVVAKLDRLSCKVSFIASLMEEKGLEFRVAQMPMRTPSNSISTQHWQSKNGSSYPREPRQHLKAVKQEE